MSNFKVGQRVVAIKNHSQGDFKIGDEFIVSSVGFNNCCKQQIIGIGFKGATTMRCPHYNGRTFVPELMYRSRCFADAFAEETLSRIAEEIEKEELILI